MIYQKEHLLKILFSIHLSEKASFKTKNTNTIVFRVDKNVTKPEIKASVQTVFKVEVEVVNTLVVKGKIKRHGKYVGRRSNWKKAYVTLKKGQNLDFFNAE